MGEIGSFNAFVLTSSGRSRSMVPDIASVSADGAFLISPLSEGGEG